MPRDNRCMYMEHVCFYVCFSDCVGVRGKVGCVVDFVEDIGFLSLGMMKYVCVRDVMDVVFSVCIVTHGAVGARVWEVGVFIMQMLYACVPCASCGSSQCCTGHVGLEVGSWPSNRATEGSNPKGT